MHSVHTYLSSTCCSARTCSAVLYLQNENITSNVSLIVMVNYNVWESSLAPSLLCFFAQLKKLQENELSSILQAMFVIGTCSSKEFISMVTHLSFALTLFEVF